MVHDSHDPLHHPEVQLASGWGYVAAFVLATGLMAGVLFIATHPGLVHPAMAVAAGAAAVAVLVQLVFLFQLNFSRTQVWTTVSFLLIVPLFVIAVGLTMWMFHALDARTMLMGLMR